MALKTFLQLYDNEDKYIETVEYIDSHTFYTELREKYPNYKRSKIIIV